jgi:crotonobetainyl-CoA:carnitine CoA-transferase CaiB-like acyl-CoA transferase
MPLPLEGIRIIELSVIIALPLGGGLLADLGAEVIRIDPCSRLDTRTGGPQPDGRSTERYWNTSGNFNWMHRGKESLALNLQTREGLEAFRELVRVSDVVCDNFTREVMARWGFDYAGLKKIKPDIIALSNTGWGHTGPWRDYPGLAQAVECLTGLANYTGYLHGQPSRVGQNYFDTACAMNMAGAISAALIYRHRTGKGQFIDHSMLEACAQNTAETMLEYQMTGRNGERWGARNPAYAPQGCYPCKGNDRWIIIGITSDEEWQSFVQAAGSPAWARDAKYKTVLGRRDHHDELDERIAAWTKDQDSYELMHKLQRAGVPAGAVLSGKDFLLDPQIKARGYFELIDQPAEPAVGVRPYAGRPWRSSLNDLTIRHAAPTLGQHNEYVLHDLLGHPEDEVESLYEKGAIGTSPVDTGPPPRQRSGLQQQRDMGMITDFDLDYKEKLGIG